MKTEKSVYSAPKAKCFEVHLNSTILQGSLNGAGGNRFTDPNADVVDGNSDIFW